MRLYESSPWSHACGLFRLFLGAWAIFLLPMACNRPQKESLGQLIFTFPQSQTQALQTAVQRRDSYLLAVSGPNITQDIQARIDMPLDPNIDPNPSQGQQFSLVVPAGPERTLVVTSYRNDTTPPLPTYVDQQQVAILAGQTTVVDMVLRPAGLFQGRILFPSQSDVETGTLRLERLDPQTGQPLDANSLDVNTMAQAYLQSTWITDVKGAFSMALPVGSYRLSVEVFQDEVVVDYGPPYLLTIEQGERTQLFVAPWLEQNECLPNAPIDADRDGSPCHVDCDDRDPDNWQADACTQCQDQDGDGYYSGCDRYTTHLGPDCDDEDGDNWRQCKTCVDLDNDGYYVGCDRYLQHLGPDCNDADTSNWSLCATCIDGDGDGYSIGCNRYIGQTRGPDCSDADPWNQVSCASCSDSDNDGAYVGCDVYDNTRPFDCNDNNPCVFQMCRELQDKDGDGWVDRCTQVPTPAGITLDPSPLEPLCPLNAQFCGPRMAAMPDGIEISFPPHIQAQRYQVRVSSDLVHWRTFDWANTPPTGHQLALFKVYEQNSNYLPVPSPFLLRQLDSQLDWSIELAYEPIGSLAQVFYGSTGAQPIKPQVADPFIAIAIGKKHNLALTASGEVWAWGDNRQQQCGQATLDPNREIIWQPEIALTGKGIIAIAAGNQHSAAIDSNGQLWLWGDNSTSAVDPNTLPTPMANQTLFAANPLVAAKPIVQASLGDGWTMYLLNDGSVYAIGRNESGQLGLGHVSSFDQGQTSSLSQIKTIAAGDRTGYALDHNQVLWGWGDNNDWQLLLDPNLTAHLSTPAPLNIGLSTAQQLDAGPAHLMFLSQQGEMYGWGNNQHWQLSQAASQPATVSTRLDWMPQLQYARAIATGPSHTLVINANGKVLTVGNNTDGQLGRGLTGGFQNFFDAIQLPKGANITAVGAGEQHSVLLAQDGRLWSMGANTFGQLGKNQDGNSLQNIPMAVEPVLLPNRRLALAAPQVRLTGISAGATYGMALDETGKLWSFGAVDTQGLLQNNTDPNQGWMTPQELSTEHQLPKFAALAAGPHHGLLLTSLGKLWGFGENRFGQLGLTPEPTSPRPLGPIPTTGLFRGVMTSGRHSLALERDGETVFGFGDNQLGRTGHPIANAWMAPTPVPLPGMITGPITGMGIGPNNGFAWQNKPAEVILVGWGDNAFGQLQELDGNPKLPMVLPFSSNLPNPLIQVCAGTHFALALDVTGSIYLWGSNQGGVLADPNVVGIRRIPQKVQGLPKIVHAMCGHASVVAMDGQGSIWSWGLDIIDQVTPRTLPIKLATPLPKGIDQPPLQNYFQQMGPLEPFWQGSRPWGAAGLNPQGHIVQMVWFAQGGIPWRLGATSALDNYVAGDLPAVPTHLARPLVGF